MLGRAAAVLLLSILAIPQALFGQCNYRAAASYPFRSSVFDVALDSSGWILVANGYGVGLYSDASTPPTAVTTLGLPGTTRILRRAGTFTYVGSGTNIVVVAVRQPTEHAGAGLFLQTSVDTGSVVNDLLPAGIFLYAATATGLQQYNTAGVVNLAAPVRTGATFATSSPNTIALAIDGTNLYVADSDNTIEVFSVGDPANPQKLGTITSLPRVTSVKVLNGYLFASDGVQTDVFLLSGGTPAKIATVPFGTTSLAPVADNTIAIAGNDRRIHILDISSIGAPVELFATDLLPTGGTINRIGAIQVSGNRLYAAAGDIGLAVYDLSAFQPPYPLRSYASGATSSIVTTPTRIYAALSSGGLIELSQSASGSVTRLRQWEGAASIVHDANDFLLTSSGSTLTYWTLTSTTPVAVSTATFSAPVQSAVVIDRKAYVILSSQTLWLVDLAQTSPTPTQLGTPAQHPALIARSGSSIAIADLRDDGTTAIINYRNGSTLEIPRTANVTGVATAFAHNGNLAAVFTFRGITVVDLAAGTQKVMSQSTSAIPTGLAIDGHNVLATTSNGLTVWDARTGALLRTIPLPSPGTRVAVPDTSTGFAAIATSDGVTSVVYNSQSQLPSRVPVTNVNAYYKKVLAANNRIYVFDGRGIDLFETAYGVAPHYLTHIAPPGVFDVAAGDGYLFALSSNGTVYSYKVDGTPIAQSQVTDTANDSTPLSIIAIAGVPWVSVAQGCTTSTCQNVTYVLDPQTLAKKTVVTGRITSAVVSGARAYIVTSLPDEIRIVNITNPLFPQAVSARATEGATAPVSIAFASNTIFVLGEKLYAYSDATLQRIAQQDIEPDAATYADQRIVISGSCAVVTGRAATPALYSVPSLAPAGSIDVPALVRSVAVSGDKLYLLTDDSLEVWTTGTPKPGPRRRAVR